MSFADLLAKAGLTENVPDAPTKRPSVAQSIPQPIAVHPSDSKLELSSFASYVPPVVADPRAVTKLQSKLSAAMAQVPEYQHFSDQYETLKEVIADEATRFKAALKTSKTTPEQLSGALDQLIGVMATALDDFEKKFEGEKTTALSGCSQRVAALDQMIATKRAQAATLLAEVESAQAEQRTESDQATAESVRLDGIKTGFEAAHAQVLGQLTQQKARIAKG